MIYYLGEIALSADQTKIGHSYQTGRINLALLQLTQKGPDTKAPDLFQKSKIFYFDTTSKMTLGIVKIIIVLGYYS